MEQASHLSEAWQHPRYRPAPLVGSSYRRREDRTELARTFASNGVAVLPRLIEVDALPTLTAAVAGLATSGRRRDFQMPGYDTPRKLTVLGGRMITAQSPLIRSLYDHPEIRAVIADIVGQPIFECRHPDEFLVLNHLAFRDDTHGWHLDDPSWALVIVLEAPLPGAGGKVEIVQPTEELGAFSAETTNAVVERARALGRVVELDLAAGDAYLLRADKCLHRVAPLTLAGARRSALNLAFEESATPAHAKFLQTTTLMYGDVPD